MSWSWLDESGHYVFITFSVNEKKFVIFNLCIFLFDAD